MRTFGQRWFKDGSLMAEYSEHFGRAVTRHKSMVALGAAIGLVISVIALLFLAPVVVSAATLKSMTTPASR